MLTIKAEILKAGLKNDGTYNIKVRLTYNREVKRLSTNLFATQADITRSLKLKDGTPVKLATDKLIHSYQEICTKLQLETKSYTIDDIIAHLKGEQRRSQEIDFIQFSREWIAHASIKGVENYTTAINAFVSFLGKEELNISQLNKGLLERFTTYINARREAKLKELIKQGKRIPSNRAVSLYLGSIRHLFNEAKRQYNDYDRNIILISNSPFDNFKIPKQEATRKRAISAEIIKQIYKLPYHYNSRGREIQGRYNLAKDCFILSFCLIGINSADLYNCTELKENVITYYRTKTTNRRSDRAKMKVEIPTMLMPVLEKYRDTTGQRIFNFYHYYSTADSFNKAINYGLKEIGKLVSIDDLEYYAARHSWATIAVNKVGINKYTVHAALNHIDESMRVTDIYIERDFKIENEANKKVVEYVFGNQSELSSPEVK